MGTMFNHNACNRMKYAHRVAQVLFSSDAKLFQCFLERGENDLGRKEEKKDGEKTVHAKRMEMKKKKKKIEQNLNTRQYNTRKMAAGMIFIRSFYTIV